ncbi:MAG TPA: (Fe-S)-binding protein, partial [Bacteroidales bacterium]|nr:(Fe-S)-binding protein [Bacteroidales bacterium]
SFMATRLEHNTTRARANILREFITNSSKKNPFNHQEIYDVLDLCLSCKACKAECPSNVDMAKLKGEFLQHYYDSNGVPFRTMVIAYITSINQFGALIPSITNLFLKPGLISSAFKSILGFAKPRSMPLLSSITLKKWFINHSKGIEYNKKQQVLLFADEFTNYNESEIGIKTIMLLEYLGYEVIIPRHVQSGRTFISKGLLRKAKE